MPQTANDIRRAIGSGNFAGQTAFEKMLAYWTSDGAPSIDSDRIGRDLLDATNSDWYVAVAVGTGASDWKKTTP